MVSGRGENIICVPLGPRGGDELSALVEDVYTRAGGGLTRSHPSIIADIVLTSSEDAFVLRLLDGFLCAFVFPPS